MAKDKKENIAQKTTMLWSSYRLRIGTTGLHLNWMKNVQYVHGPQLYTIHIENDRF